VRQIKAENKYFGSLWCNCGRSGGYALFWSDEGGQELPGRKKCVKRKQDKSLIPTGSGLNIGFSNIFYESINQLCAMLLCRFALK
jgi:hypothetical protein